jgi:hypothetical protein
LFDFKITPDDGESFEVKATTRDVLKWERTTKGAKFSDIADGMKITDMYKIAWLASGRQNLFNGTLADFEDSVDLEFEEEEEPDPTQPAP